MKILVSAFAFAPLQGSEPGVGWNWTMELAKEHEVFVITDITRRTGVESAGFQIPSNVRIVYFRPQWLLRAPLNSRTAQVLYTLWQFGLLPFAKRLHAENRFDLAMHLTYSVFRHPSFLGWLGIPFIFGPVGGGEDAPWALKQSIRGTGKIKEVARTLINKVVLADPFLWLAYAKATVILVATEQTRQALPFPFRQRAHIYPNLGMETLARTPQARQPGQPLRVMYAGRLLGWKGVHLAIAAVAQALRNGVDIEFSVLGKGTYETELRRLAIELKVGERIMWKAHMTNPQTLQYMSSQHVFLYPSLHDSGATVVLEAQSCGLPVVCLDLGGPESLVAKDSALVIKTAGADESDVVRQLAEALSQLAQNETARMAMGAAGIQHIQQNMSWKSRVLNSLKYLPETKS